MVYGVAIVAVPLRLRCVVPHGPSGERIELRWIDQRPT